jgi:tetratricopeptide (TPR) repeat protein
MGWLSWLIPSEADRVRKARRLVDRGDPLAAWRELEDIESAAAISLREEATAAVVHDALAKARADIDAGGWDVAGERLELAARFSEHRFDPEIRDCRRALREARRAEPVVLPKPKKAAASCASGTCGMGQASDEPVEMPSPGFAADPVFSLPPDDPRVRYAMILESYPEELRSRLLALGGDFAAIALSIEDGRAREAWEELGPYVGREPAAHFQRALAAMECNMLQAAIVDLEHFVGRFGHMRLGMFHTGVLLARLSAGQGRADRALEILAEAKRATPQDLELLAVQAHIEESSGDVDAAERSMSDYLRRAGRDLGGWKVLARLRARKNDRNGAMQALESGLSTCCKGPGRCGSQPLDAGAARMLAQLYLEDGIESTRADDLLRQISELDAEPDWLDGYLVALRARNQGDPSLRDRVRALVSETSGPEDPRWKLIEQHFAPVLEAGAAPEP